MSKELTPLEALEILKEANTIYCGCASNLFARYRFEIETIETALKALEIIKEKGVNVFDEIQMRDNYEDYIDQLNIVWKREKPDKVLTKEEFELLKEELEK